jgi:hypothetical protein
MLKWFHQCKPGNPERYLHFSVTRYFISSVVDTSPVTVWISCVSVGRNYSSPTFDLKYCPSFDHASRFLRDLSPPASNDRAETDGRKRFHDSIGSWQFLSTFVKAKSSLLPQDTPCEVDYSVA